MSRLIKAEVITNSSDDKYSRVKLKSEGIWNESNLVESVNSIPLIKGDIVYVDVTNGFEAPLILGKSETDQSKHSKSVDGSVLFESSNGTDWTVCFVKNDTLEIQNSGGIKITINKSGVNIE